MWKKLSVLLILAVVGGTIAVSNAAAASPNHARCEPSWVPLPKYPFVGGFRHWPTFSFGDHGVVVETIQYLLRSCGFSIKIDGHFGPQTRSVLATLKRRRGFGKDGANFRPEDWEALTCRLYRGSRGDMVRAAQVALRFRGCNVRVDGIFGPATFRAVKAFQRKNVPIADGIVGPYTWCELVGGSNGPDADQEEQAD